MSLFIRVDLSFWTHRKTLRLRAVVGNDAFWIPLKLWAYAAQNQPDGNFSDYSDEEIAVLIGYAGNAQALLQALIDLGFINADRTIHDWAEYNGFHHAHLERARKAAAARWKGHKKKEPKKNKSTEYMRGEEKSKHTSSNAKALEIYLAYPKKVGRPDALRAIKRALQKFGDDFFETMLNATKHYSSIRNGDLDFVPHPATWFNQERFNDDPKTWEPRRHENNRPPTNKERQQQLEMDQYERDVAAARQAKQQGLL